MPSSGGIGTSESIGISSPFLEALGRMGIFLAVPVAVLVGAALVFEELVNLGFRSLDSGFDLAGDLGLDDQDVSSLVEGVIGDGQLDLGLGEFLRPTTLEPPSDTRRVAIVSITYFLEVKTLTCQLEFLIPGNFEP